MGWDISYHPISEAQIYEWYFDVLENPKLKKKLTKKHNIEKFYKEKYKTTIKAALDTKEDESFDKTHAFYIAVVQGFFQTFFYTRGSALSFMDDAVIKNYTKKWESFIPEKFKYFEINNAIEVNCSGGVFMSFENVCKLLDDYKNNTAIKAIFDEHFSIGRVDVFLNALNFAKENGLGLLEATEVVEPYPFDLNESSSYSNLYNCNIEGPILFQEAALEQVKELKKSK